MIRSICLKVPLSSSSTSWLVSALALALSIPVSGQKADQWELEMLHRLCGAYVESCVDEDASGMQQTRRLEQVALSLGRRLASSGTSAVPAEDIATLALLLSRRTETSGALAAGKPNENLLAADARSAQDSQQRGSSVPVGQAEQRSSPASSSGAIDAGQDTGFADISKGEEGFRQGVERLTDLPITERVVMTGDITSGLQAATVSAGSDLTSTFGRVRVNFVTRAVPASADGRLSEGYFFVQMRAAGGPFDTSAVGGPSPFSPLNDVATDRSRFNEGTSRGNLYLAKAFYQQELRLGDDHIVGRMGIINLSDFFDTNDFANNEARQFLSSAFVNSAAYKTGISAPGLMGEYHRKTNGDWLQKVVFRTGYAISRTERAFTSPIWAGEVEMQTTMRGRRGKYRFGGTLGNVADIGGVRGLHLGFDQWVSAKLGVYGRYAWSSSSPASLTLGPVRQSYSGGVQRRFVNEGDRVSAWAIGISQAFGIETEESLASERILETYYRWQLSNNFSLTPDFQLVFGSGGSEAQGTHVVTGMRMTFGF